jgi:hypothetical protein
MVTTQLLSSLKMDVSSPRLRLLVSIPKLVIAKIGNSSMRDMTLATRLSGFKLNLKH